MGAMLRRDGPGWAYALAAAAAFLVQHAAVALAFRVTWAAMPAGLSFWLMPLRAIPALPSPGIGAGMAAFALALFSDAFIASLSFRRAGGTRAGFLLALLSVLPLLQVGAVAIIALLPPEPKTERLAEDDMQADELSSIDAAHVLQGLLAGAALIVAAVLVSAVTFGAYGWGLFFLTPFTVGFTTAFLANRRTTIGSGRTIGLVLVALVLGGLSLVLFALEGAICIVLASPLAALVAVVGAGIGRNLAAARNGHDRPLMAVALLPAVFALEAAIPPSALFETHESIDTAAAPAAVWRALTSDAPIAVPPGLTGRAGLAYPLRGKLLGRGVGAARIGVFSTGLAHERVTAWEPGRLLAFRVVAQPPAMEEMSPYRRVHAPHVLGYFETGETRFTLRPLRGGGTHIDVAASHQLRIDPIPYWEPLARWAASANSRRVLVDLKNKAERGG